MIMIDDFDISEIGMDDYPFTGAFFTYEIDEDADLINRVPQEIEVFSTQCDIQKNSRLHSGGFLGADYCVYWPLEENPEWDGTDPNMKFKPIKVRRGMTFKGDMYGYPVVGEVEVVRPSQLGGCSCDIKVKTESEL